MKNATIETPEVQAERVGHQKSRKDSLIAPKGRQTRITSRQGLKGRRADRTQKLPHLHPPTIPPRPWARIKVAQQNGHQDILPYFSVLQRQLQVVPHVTTQASRRNRQLQHLGEQPQFQVNRWSLRKAGMRRSRKRTPGRHLLKLWSASLSRGQTSGSPDPGFAAGARFPDSLGRGRARLVRGPGRHGDARGRFRADEGGFGLLELRCEDLADVVVPGSCSKTTRARASSSAPRHPPQ